MLWKLDGLSEYDIRRPLTPTGTNLLGLVKHLASVELGYFGEVFGRPSDIPLPWFEENAEPNADLWATVRSHARRSSPSTGRPGITRMPPSRPWTSTLAAMCRGGRKVMTGRRCTSSSCT